jgi:hypothetical protein
MIGVVEPTTLDCGGSYQKEFKSEDRCTHGNRRDSQASQLCGLEIVFRLYPFIQVEDPPLVRFLERPRVVYENPYKECRCGARSDDDHEESGKHESPTQALLPTRLVYEPRGEGVGCRPSQRGVRQIAYRRRSRRIWVIRRCALMILNIVVRC